MSENMIDNSAIVKTEVQTKINPPLSKESLEALNNKYSDVFVTKTTTDGTPYLHTIDNNSNYGWTGNTKGTNTVLITPYGLVQGVGADTPHFDSPEFFDPIVAEAKKQYVENGQQDQWISKDIKSDFGDGGRDWVFSSVSGQEYSFKDVLDSRHPPNIVVQHEREVIAKAKESKINSKKLLPTYFNLFACIRSVLGDIDFQEQLTKQKLKENNLVCK
jgi:hypothetical protein